jgi:hypothetical protein
VVDFMSLTPAAFGCAPLGRTSCGGQSALPQHFVLRRNSSLRLFGVGEPGVLFRSRQQPTAALRWGALRAAASRPCLSTSCFGGIHHYGYSGSENRVSYSAHASSLRLRSAGAHFVRRPVGLASALRASEEFITMVVQGRRTARGTKCRVKLFDQNIGSPPIQPE